MSDITNKQFLRSLRNAKQDEIIGALEGYLHMFFDDPNFEEQDKLIHKFIEKWGGL